jgi:hypothetical protein
MAQPTVAPPPAQPRPVTPPVAEDPQLPEPEPIASDAAGIERLMRVGALREVVLLHHPQAATRANAFDSALVRAVPAIRAATSDAVLGDVLRRLLRVLEDPSLEVGAPSTAEAGPVVSPVPAAVATRWTTDSVLVITAPTDGVPAPDALAAATALAAAARHVVLDLRASRALDSASARQLQSLYAQSRLFETINDGPAALPALRRRRLDGAATGWQVEGGAPLAALATPVPPTPPVPARRRRGEPPPPPVPIPRRIAIIANETTTLPLGALALVHAGRATLVAERGVQATVLVPRVEVPVGATVAVRLPIAELVHADGSAGVMADTVVPSATGGTMGDSIPALRTSLAIVRTGVAPRAERPRAPFVVAAPLVADTTAYPAMGQRILAGWRVWSALRTLHVHRDLYDRDPDEVLAEVLPRLETARDAQGHATALAALAATLDDAQGRLQGPGADAAFGPASAPFRARLIEGRAIVTDVVQEPEAAALGVRVGDELVAADGFPLVGWLSERRWLVSASNDWTRTRDLVQLMSRGQERPASYRVRDAAGSERQLMVPRRVAWRDSLERPARWNSTAVRLMPGGVLYVDAERVDAAAAAALLDTVTAVRGLLLDLRGGVIADSVWRARLLGASPQIGARIGTRNLVAPCIGATVRVATIACPQERREDSEWVAGRGQRFTGRIVVLIDERTQGAAERLALHLDAGARVTFAGSSSAGALGAVALVPLPGGLALPVTVEEVRRGDGGQVQRLGITPSVSLRPTVRSVRNGGDEVLERAHQWLLQQLDPQPRRR